MGSTIAYWERNPRGQRTILFVHGFRGNHKALTAMSRDLDGCRIILIDLPGYGESTPMTVPHTMDNYVEALEMFCTKLKLRSLIVWGHSFGGTICILFAGRTSLTIQKLILVSPGLPNKGLLAQAGILYYQIARLLPETLCHPWLINPLFIWASANLLIKNVSRKRRKKLVDDGLRDTKIHSNVIIEGFLSFYEADPMSFAHRIDSPTLIVAGGKDGLVPVRALNRLKRTIKKCDMVVLPDEGHLSPLEQPGRVATITRRFLL